MTISEMHTAFNLELDKVNSLQYPSFTNNEKDYWLNRAIREFVKTRYSGNNFRKEGFEQSQKRIDDLRTLVREVTIPCTSSGATKPNGYVLTNGFSNTVFSTAGAYWLSLGEEVSILVGTISSRVGVTEITADEYSQEIDNPFSSYILHYNQAKPLRLFYNNTIEFITDGNYSVTNAYIRYLKSPAVVAYSGTSCDLPEHTHDEIVCLAVRLALENIEQPRHGSYAEEMSVTE
jgi:hypothetical protein